MIDKYDWGAGPAISRRERDLIKRAGTIQRERDLIKHEMHREYQHRESNGESIEMKSFVENHRLVNRYVNCHHGVSATPSLTFVDNAKKFLQRVLLSRCKK